MLSFVTSEWIAWSVFSTIVTTVALLGAVCCRRKDDPKAPPKRKMSAMTHMLSCGGLPREAGVTHHVMSSAIFVAKLPPTDFVKKRIQEDVLPFFRFRSLPVGWTWKDVPVDLDAHVLLTEVENDQEMHSEFERLINTPIDTSRPLWEIILISNKAVPQQSPPSETALQPNRPLHAIVIRAEHYIGDGVSLVEVFSRMMTDMDGHPLTDGETLMGLQRNSPWRLKRVARREKRQSAPQPLRSWIDLVRFVSFVKHRFLGVIAKVLRGLPHALVTVHGPYDTETAFSPPLSIKKQGVKFPRDQKIAMEGPWSLAYIKQIKTKLSVSINDVMLGCFAGAVRRYNKEFSSDGNGELQQQEQQQPVRCRALMPFAFLRKPISFGSKDDALRNDWTFVSVGLHTNEASAEERVRATNSETVGLKNRLQPVTNKFVATVITHISETLTQQNCWQMMSRHSVIFANVPGPARKARYLGEPIERIQVFFANTIPQVEIFSYAGQVFYNICASPSVVKNIKRLSELMTDEIYQLGSQLKVEGTLCASSTLSGDVPPVTHSASFSESHEDDDSETQTSK